MLKADLHTHTVNSGDGLNTLYEMVKEASERKVELIGITPHGPSLAQSFPVQAYGVFNRVPKHLFGVRVLMSAELNILDIEGKVDIENENFKMNYYIRGLGVLITLQEFMELEIKATEIAIENNHILFFIKPISCFIENMELNNHDFHVENVSFSLN